MAADTAVAVQVSTPAPLRRFSWPQPKALLFVFIALMYAYVLWHNESFLFNSKDPEWAHIGSFKWFLLPHGLAAACALFLGPLQFSDRLRKRFAKVHRVMGRFYVAGVLVGAPLGIYIQHFEEHMGRSRSFTLAAAADAAVWIFCTLVALTFILKRNVQLHRQWMTRSFACAIIFLEVRVVQGVFHLDERFTEIIVWGCVVAAVPLADLILQAPELFRTHATSAKLRRPAPQTV
ncbi:MAG: hypothetical protein QOK38_3614 [Acidobacteriaceae bacterium]|jgi:uncharacterized membrane protein|nr:hypothetical protein [Acidobacteriaceae bacterium]